MHFSIGNYASYTISSLARSNHVVHVAAIIVTNKPPGPATKNQRMSR